MFHQLFKIRSPYNYLDGKLLMTPSMNDVMTIMLSATWSNSDQHLHRLPGGVRPAQAAGTASAMPGRRRARDGSGGEHHHLGLAPPARRRRWGAPSRRRAAAARTMRAPVVGRPLLRCCRRGGGGLGRQVPRRRRQRWPSLGAGWPAGACRPACRRPIAPCTDWSAGKHPSLLVVVASYWLSPCLLVSLLSEQFALPRFIEYQEEN